MGEKGAEVLLRTKFRYLFGGLMALMLLAGLLSVGIQAADNRPSEVPVFYEPERSDFENNRGPEPSRDDYGGFWETTTTDLTPPEWPYGIGSIDRARMPAGFIVPLPKPPGRAAVYESALTAKRQYTKTETIVAWRWGTSATCDNVTTQKDWTDTIDCAALEAKLLSPEYRDDHRLNLGRRAYSNLDYVAELYYGVTFRRDKADKIVVWKNNYVPETVEQARLPGTVSRQIVDGEGNPLLDEDSNPVDRPPQYNCPTKDEKDRICQLQPGDTKAHLADDGLDAEMIAIYLGIIDNYTEEETIDRADYAAAKVQWRADSDLINNHNRSVREIHQPTVTRTYKCDSDCETAFLDALAEWNSTSPFDSAGYAKARNDYASRESQTGMYVDCTLSDCVVVNPVR